MKGAIQEKSLMPAISATSEATQQGHWGCTLFVGTRTQIFIELTCARFAGKAFTLPTFWKNTFWPIPTSNDTHVTYVGGNYATIPAIDAIWWTFTARKLPVIFVAKTLARQSAWKFTNEMPMGWCIEIQYYYYRLYIKNVQWMQKKLVLAAVYSQNLQNSWLWQINRLEGPLEGHPQGWEFESRFVLLCTWQRLRSH